MKIEKISIKNMIAVRDVEISVSTPITLICGPNEAGKSSVCEGIKHALTGNSTRVALKKDYKFLVNDNDQVGYAYVEYDGGKRACITVPNGTNELNEQLHPALPYVLDPHLFAELSANDKRRVLFDVAGIKQSGAGVKAKLLERGCEADKIERILPHLIAGFDNAQTEAKTQARDSKTAWRVVTGETYGEKKAEIWEMPSPITDAGLTKDLLKKNKAELQAIDDEIEIAMQKFGAMKSAKSSAQKNDSDLIKFQSQAEKLDRIKAKLSKDRQEVAAWTVKVEDSRRFAVGTNARNIALKCPECEAEVIFNGAKLEKIGGDLHGDEEVASKLPEYDQALTLFKNAVTSGERDLVNAEFAAEKLREYKDKSEEIPSDEAIEKTRTGIESLKINRKNLNEKINALLREEISLKDFEKKNADAKKHHTDCAEWEAIAQALAPDGIPGEILSAALDPFNERMKASAELSNFKTISLNNDMELLCNGRPYGLESESARWRADAIIAEAISFLSGIKFFMLDRFDVLDLRGRDNLIYWLGELAGNADIDSCIIFGTLKALPPKLPSTSSFWIDHGVLK